MIKITGIRWGIPLFFGLLAVVLVQWPGVASPASIIYFDLVIDEARQQLYGTDRVGGSIDVISMATLDVVSTINVGVHPSGLDMDPNGNELAVALSGDGQIAFVDLNTLSVTSRIVPSGTWFLNIPYDVLYGRPGRLYSVGSPDSGGLDVVHVYDTATKTELGRSADFMRSSPRLAMTADQNTLFVSQVFFSPQQIFRFDVTSDTPIQTGTAPHGPAQVDTLCVMPDGRIFTSYGQVWSADLNTLLVTLPAWGTRIECSESLQKVYISQGTMIHAFDANNYSEQLKFNLGVETGVARVDDSGTKLYVSTSDGIKSLSADYKLRAFLPSLVRPLDPGIHGRVTRYGGPGSYESLELRYYNGSSWSTRATTTASSSGRFFFGSVPALKPGERYYVLYRNTNGVQGLLWVWGTRTLSSFTSGEGVWIGEFDIADITLTSPANEATVGIPTTFQWTARPATPADSYEFNLFDPTDEDPYFYTNPPLGYTNSYTVSSLPVGFKNNTWYVWDLWVYSPDGGYGISYQAWWVRFTGTNMDTPMGSSPGALEHRTVPDDPAIKRGP